MGLLLESATRTNFDGHEPVWAETLRGEKTRQGNPNATRGCLTDWIAAAARSVARRPSLTAGFALPLTLAHVYT